MFCIFLACIIGFFGRLPVGMLRSYSSKLVNPNEIGEYKIFPIYNTSKLFFFYTILYDFSLSYRLFKNALVDFIFQSDLHHCHL